MAKKKKFLKWFPNAVYASVVTTFVHDWVWCRSSVSQQTAALLFSRCASLLCLPPSPTTRESLLVIYELVCGLDYEKGGGVGRAGLRLTAQEHREQEEVQAHSSFLISWTLARLFIIAD